MEPDQQTENLEFRNNPVNVLYVSKEGFYETADRICNKQSCLTKP